MEKYRFHLSKGRQLGKNYIILEPLGNGWEGEVYKVEERQTGIVRAAKLFYKKPSTKRIKPHILYAKKLFKLRNCPIVTQYHNYDVAIIKKEPTEFLISEFVDGEVLANYLQRQPQQRLLPFEALHLFYSLVQGVEHIHFLGEYHGDIHLENIIVKRSGLGFNVSLIDLLHLGKPSKAKIQTDVVDLINVFYQMVGGGKHYASLNPNIKKIILGRRKSLIAKQFKTAGHLRLFLENLDWE